MTIDVFIKHNGRSAMARYDPHMNGRIDFALVNHGRLDFPTMSGSNMMNSEVSGTASTTFKRWLSGALALQHGIEQDTDEEFVARVHIIEETLFDAPRRELEELMKAFARRQIEEIRECGICRKTKFAPPLKSYDLKYFPRLKGKVVCTDCRLKFYDKMKQKHGHHR